VSSPPLCANKILICNHLISLSMEWSFLWGQRPTLCWRANFLRRMTPTFSCCAAPSIGRWYTCCHRSVKKGALNSAFYRKHKTCFFRTCVQLLRSVWTMAILIKIINISPHNLSGPFQMMGSESLALCISGAKAENILVTLKHVWHISYRLQQGFGKRAFTPFRGCLTQPDHPTFFWGALLTCEV